MRKCKKHKEVTKKNISFYMKHFHRFHFWRLLFEKLQRERSHFEKAPAGDGQTIILQKHLGNRNWSRARAARPHARTHERNETISREGPLELKPPSLRYIPKISQTCPKQLSDISSGILWTFPGNVPDTSRKRPGHFLALTGRLPIRFRSIIRTLFSPRVWIVLKYNVQVQENIRKK